MTIAPGDRLHITFTGHYRGTSHLNQRAIRISSDTEAAHHDFTVPASAVRSASDDPLVAENARLHAEIARLRQVVDNLTNPKPGDDDYCDGELSLDGQHTSDYRKSDLVCEWCGADPDQTGTGS